MKLQRKSVKGFTLIELIIVMAIFGIIMTALVQFVNPVEKAYNSTELMAQQRYAQNNMIKYLTESTKYANAVCIIERDDVQNITAARNYCWNNVINGMSYVDSLAGGIAQTKDYEVKDIQVIEINRASANGGKHGFFKKLAGGKAAEYVALKNVYGAHDYRILITGFVDRQKTNGTSSSYDVAVSSIYERGGAKYKLTSTDTVRMEGGALLKDIGGGVFHSSNGPNSLSDPNPSQYPVFDASIAEKVFVYYGNAGEGIKDAKDYGQFNDAGLEDGNYPGGLKNSYICYVSMDDPS